LQTRFCGFKVFNGYLNKKRFRYFRDEYVLVTKRDILKLILKKVFESSFLEIGVLSQGAGTKCSFIKVGSS
jgi:hypothetical protein